MKRTVGTLALNLGLIAMTAAAQDMMRHVDLSSPDMVSAEMTRGEVEAALAAATVAAPADFIEEIVRPRPLRRDLSRGTAQ
jgi:hypothetical protein